MLRWSTKRVNGQYKDGQLTKHTHRYHHNHLHHHPLHSQHWHDSRCRLTDPHINLFCILLTITPATPGLNIFPHFRQKYLCNKENFVKREFPAKKLWCFDPSLRPECSFTGSEASIHNKTQPRQDYTHTHVSTTINQSTTTQTRKPDDRNTDKHPNHNNKNTIVFGRVILSQSLQCHRSGLLIFHSRSGFKVCVHELWKQNIQVLLGSDQRIPSSWRFLVWLNELSFLCTLIIGIIGS